ncbi:MAG: glutamate synthase subunit beta [SAR202 cluster bacterium]|nr:glutamate synthase subunit beta [SAR202 cluster bacterium]
MGKPTGFFEHPRQGPKRRPVDERLRDWQEVYQPWPEKEARQQAARCMDCGIPFCNKGCPLGNLIPDWNDLVYRGQWRAAIEQLHATNNFPEFTGRICPAPCEPACTLSINQDPVTIEMIEKAISEKAWEEGWITPQKPTRTTGKKVAVVGSGPSGLAAAQQLRRVGHAVTVFERAEVIGGLLSLGIPDFKLEKRIVKRRIDQMRAEGVVFKTNAHIGKNVPTSQLREQFDAIVLAGGSTAPRDLPVPGRELDGIHFAMDYLTQQNRRGEGAEFSPEETITADARHVIILGGGDTGADCLGTAHRQNAEHIWQYEIMPRPPDVRGAGNPWPQWPIIMRSSSAHEEGGERGYNILTKSFSGENGKVKFLHGVRIEWKAPVNGGRPQMVEVPGSEFTVRAELVLLALGFVHPEHEGMLKDLGVQLDPRGNVKTLRKSMTSQDGVFACGDMQRGQSLVVWAIASGRQCARDVDEWLMGSSDLPAVQQYARNLLSVARPVR